MKHILSALALLLTACASASGDPVVRLDTTQGTIEITVYPDRAPVSAADFLRYVDDGLYDGQGFYRTVRADNDPRGMGNEPDPRRPPRQRNGRRPHCA